MAVPGGGDSTGKRIEAKGNAVLFWSSSHVATVGKKPFANTRGIRDAGSILGSGRSPGGRHGRQPTPVFLPGNIMDREAWQTLLSIGSQRVGHD